MRNRGKTNSSGVKTLDWVYPIKLVIEAYARFFGFSLAFLSKLDQNNKSQSATLSAVMPKKPVSEQRSSNNMALFARFSDQGFLVSSLTTCISPVSSIQRLLLFSDNQLVLDAISTCGSFESGDIKLDALAFDASIVLDALHSKISECQSPVTIVVDLSWVSDALDGSSAIESWSSVAEQLAFDQRCTVVSLYNLDLLVENRMQAALRAHSDLLAPSGTYHNPFWLPSTLAARSTLDEQMAFLLGRIVPDYSDITFFDGGDRSFARGANPVWLPTTKYLQAIQTTTDCWHIHCLGPLRVYKDANNRVDWKLRGSSPNKSRVLFAYLLHAGEKGAHADRIAELLWPSAVTEKVKRARLHHAVAMLRKTLGSLDSVLRSGEYYRLNAPVGSWTDISSFEQTCRRGLALFRQGLEEESLRMYLSAERLYGGDLFDDVPLEYIHNELDDWCLPRRRWLREMAIKLFRDMSVLLRSQGRTDEALEKCQKALKLDPASEEANSEAMRIFHAQGRLDAVTRQYRQYVAATDSDDGATEQASINRLHHSLVQTNAVN